MAQRRMFSKQVVRTDAFLEMPQTAQNLYFHLGMEADDDGFVNPRMVMRTVGSGDDDIRLLIARGFVIPFENGVVVVTHWKENNYLQADRKKATMYQENYQQLLCIQNVYKMDTQVRLGKGRIDNNVNVNVIKEGKKKGDAEEPKANFRTSNPSALRDETSLGRKSHQAAPMEEVRKARESKTMLHDLPNLDQPSEKTDYIASEILAVLGDANSKPFYRLVAAKIPESFIRQKLSELKQGNAHSPARVFVSIVKHYAAEKLAGQKIQGIAVAKEGLFRIGNSQL